MDYVLGFHIVEYKSKVRGKSASLLTSRRSYKNRCDISARGNFRCQWENGNICTENIPNLYIF